MRIRQLGDPILKQISQTVASHETSSEQLQGLIRQMKFVLDGIKNISDQNGNALSAPQVGQLLRLIVLRIDGEFVVMINPELTRVSKRRFDFDEECFSFYHLRGQVSRHYEVVVSYQDEAGKNQSLELVGEYAGLVQHEIDHLNGVLFIERLEDEQSLQSIEYQLRSNTDELEKARQMIAYMAG